ncbi:MAG TPA: hypothetical protein VML53_05035 [Thermoplasmata archaeon]|nr:hypothetical protein [Thermoplasmata archaeon]
MKTWAGLYAMVWLVAIELLVAVDPRPPSYWIYVHAPLGLLIVLLATVNFLAVRASAAPGRIKRTVRATLALSILMGLLGILLWANVGAGVVVALGYTGWDLLHVLHVLNALAILAQAAAAASAFDMWEEKEFERSTAPGRIPPPPSPARST